MIFVKKFLLNRSGSTLILLVIIIALTMALGASLLIVTMMNYKIKKSNTEIRQSLYMSESGLNNAYVDAYKLVSDGINDSIKKVQDYLLVYPLNEDEAKNIFVNNYKLYIIGKLKNKIANNLNPYVQVTNTADLLFIIDELNVCIQSKFFSESNIVKTTTINLIIEVPAYDDIIDNSIDISTLLRRENWEISK